MFTAFIITLIVISVCACLVNVSLGLLHRKRAGVLPVRMLAGVVSLAPVAAFILSQTFSLHLLMKSGINSAAYAFISLGVFIALTLMIPSWVDRRPKETDNKSQKVGAGKGRVRVINGSDEWVN